MPVFYWKRCTPARVLVPGYRGARSLDDQQATISDLAGVLLRRARLICDQDFHLWDAASLFMKLTAYIEWLRCIVAVAAAEPGTPHYEALRAGALAWQSQYTSIPCGDAWTALLSGARCRRRKKQGAQQTSTPVASTDASSALNPPPTTDEVRRVLQAAQALRSGVTLEDAARMSLGGAPRGAAQRDAPPLGKGEKDPVWEPAPTTPAPPTSTESEGGGVK